MPLPDLVTTHPRYDPALPSREAADYLSVHYKTLLQMTQAKELPVIRSKGGRLSYRLSDLNAYLDSRREQARTNNQPAQEIDWANL